MEQVFEAICAYETYPEFLKECKEVTVKDRKGNECNVHYRVELVKNIRYVLHMREERPNKVTWTFVEGEFMKDNKGSWLLESVGSGQTKATYAIEMSVGLMVPKVLLNTLVDANLPQMLEAFKRRVESRLKA
jgi:ribosome-associated toxin RatA of RatAB toxin-antitoxin module